MGYTQDTAAWVATAPSDWPAAALDAAERAFTDTVACMVAGARDVAPRRALAGLVNATAAHALDYDDVLDPAASHVSAALVPALLALVEEGGGDGAALLDAYLVGVEVQNGLARAVNMAHYVKGWHTTLTLGAPTVAAACARLLGLPAGQVVHAMSLATSMGAGFKRQFGTDAKPLHAGLAAKSGLMAARLAAAGLTADTAPFEGERGFLDLLGGEGAEGFAQVRPAPQASTAALAPGLWLKRYPCCASTHRPVDGLLGLMADHGLQAADIAAVDTLVSAAAVGNLMYTAPATPLQARFSMPYCIMAAALDGDLTLKTFRADAIARPEVLRLLDRVAMRSDPEQPAGMPATTKSWATTTLRTADGRSFSRTVIDPRGHPDNPLSEDELRHKFEDCTKHQSEEVERSFHGWRRLRELRNLHQLCGGLRTLGRSS